MSLVEYYEQMYKKFTKEEKQIWVEYIPTIIENRDFYTLFQVMIIIEGENFGKYSDDLLYLVKDPFYRYAIISKIVEEKKGNYMHHMINRLNHWSPPYNLTYNLTCYNEHPITLQPIHFLPSDKDQKLQTALELINHIEFEDGVIMWSDDDNDEIIMADHF